MSGQGRGPFFVIYFTLFSDAFLWIGRPAEYCSSVCNVHIKTPILPSPLDN